MPTFLASVKLIHKTKLYTLLGVLYTLFGNAQALTLEQHLKKIDKSAALRQASWGFCLISGKTGKPIAEFNSQKSLVPASVQKVITTATSLALLGDTFRFKTQVFADREIAKDGTLHGNLIIKGFGDPVLGSSKGSNESIGTVIQALADKIKSAGIKKINGNIIADISQFEYEPVPSFWTWYDIGNYYAPIINALNIGENQYELWFRPGKAVGDSTTFVKTIPYIPGLSIINHTTTASGGGDQTFIPGPPQSLEKHIYGKMPVGEVFKVKGSMPQPEKYFLYLLKEELQKLNIPVLGISSTYTATTPSKSLHIYTHYSPPLSQLCQYANYTSNNLAAECLLRTLGAEKNKVGSTQAGIEVVASFVKSRVQDARGLKLVDGSGLSKHNLVTPSQLASFLYTISTEKWSRCFVNTLPVSGKNGTLEKFCEGTVTTGKVSAKSGSMERIKCYAGYVKDKQGKMNPFAIMVNNHDVPNREIVLMIEDIMELCVQL